MRVPGASFTHGLPVVHGDGDYTRPEGSEWIHPNQHFPASMPGDRNGPQTCIF